MAKQNNTTCDTELAKLIKQKAVITGVPFLFSLLAMGFTLSAMSRIWTQYRYNHQEKSQENKQIKELLPTFQGFKLNLSDNKVSKNQFL